MPRSPQGKGTYHDVDPKHVSRHAEDLVSDAADLMQEFLRVHNMGRDDSKPRFKKGANDLRSLVEEVKCELTELPPTFPSDEQETIYTMIGLIQCALERHPAYNIPALVAIDPTLNQSFLDGTAATKPPPPSAPPPPSTPPPPPSAPSPPPPAPPEE